MKRFGSNSLRTIENGIRNGELHTYAFPFMDSRTRNMQGRRDQLRAVSDTVLRSCGEFPLNEEVLKSVLGDYIEQPEVIS